MPGLAVTDTVKRLDAARARRRRDARPRPRSSRCRRRRPSRADALRRAHAAGAEATDDAALVEAIGGRVVVVDGEAHEPQAHRRRDDLDAMRRDRSDRPVIRVGQGPDVHRFSDDPARPLVLGGVVVPARRGSTGHSDADVATHALCDAMLGAAGLGDLGRHFPDDDAAPRALVARLCSHVLRAGACGAGFVVGNADVTSWRSAPGSAGLLDEMAATLTSAGRRARVGQGDDDRRPRRDRSRRGDRRDGRRPPRRARERAMTPAAAQARPGPRPRRGAAPARRDGSASAATRWRAAGRCSSCSSPDAAGPDAS